MLDYLVLLERLEVLPPLCTVLFWYKISPLSLRLRPRVNSSVSFSPNGPSCSMVLGSSSAGPTSDENKLSPSVSSWLVEMLMSSSSGLIRSSSRTLQIRFGEFGPVSRGPPAGGGLAVLPVWLLFPSDGSKLKIFRNTSLTLLIEVNYVM